MPDSVAHDDSSRHLPLPHAGLPGGLGRALFLTVLTYVLARVHLPGPWAVTVALLIAAVKGTLVALFFMHLWYQSGANRLVFVTSLVFVALLIGLMLADNATRFPLANPPGTAGALPLGGADRDPPPDSGMSQEP